MTVTKQLSVTYHQQDRDPTGGDRKFCGAAAAQMVLNEIGAGLIDQVALYDSNHATIDTSVGWDSSPDGLECTMKKYSPSGYPITFTMWALPSEEAVARKVCWSIHRYAVAPIVLLDAIHWVVVTGFKADAEPEGPDDLLYTIDRFYIHDPYADPPTGDCPPPHDNLTDLCWSRGHPNEELMYKGWPDRLDRLWIGKWPENFFVVCDSDPPADLPYRAPQDVGDRVGAVETANRANQAYLDYDLLPPDSFIPEIGLVQGEPILVEREDRDPPQYYYLVPFRRPDGEIPLLVNVSAHEHGGVNGSITAPGGVTPFARAVDRETVIQQFAGTTVEVGGHTVTLREDQLNEHLFWRPCAESLSPYWPFYRFDVAGSDGEIRVYVRIDGELFPELHVRYGM